LEFNERIFDKDNVSESFIVDVDRRSWRINSWFSHSAWVNSNFFSANSISVRCKRSVIADGNIDDKPSSLELSFNVSGSGVETKLDPGE